MKIIVTGAIGHIGSRLIHLLPNAIPGCEIVMIDNMATQRYPSLFNLPREGNFKFIEGDVAEIDLRPIFDNADVVIQLAAITDATASFDNAAEVEQNNFATTAHVADACIETGTRLFHPSSTSVYGKQDTTVDEDCAVSDLKPQSPYAETKLREEAHLQQLSKKHGLRYVTCRFGTIFGTSPGMRFHTAVNKFCWQSIMGQPLTVWRTAMDQKRPYLDLNDAAQVISMMINQDLFDNQIYNVLTANFTVRDIIKVIKSFVPNLTVSFVESPIMNQLSYEVIFEKLQAPDG